MAKKTEKAAVKKVAAKAEKKVTAASIVLGLFALKVVPTDEAIIAAVHDGVEATKFDKTHLAWYKYQFRQGRWNDGEQQVIRQAEMPKAEKATKSAPKAAVKKAVAKKAAKKPVAATTTETEECEETEE